MTFGLSIVTSSPILFPGCNVLVKALVKEANIVTQVCVPPVMFYHNQIEFKNWVNTSGLLQNKAVEYFTLLIQS